MTEGGEGDTIEGDTLERDVTRNAWGQTTPSDVRIECGKSSQGLACITSFSKRTQRAKLVICPPEQVGGPSSGNPKPQQASVPRAH